MGLYNIKSITVGNDTYALRSEEATQSSAGLMSATDKAKLDGIAEGATANEGTITGITMNGASKGTSGVVNLGTVLTAHQDISGKADKSATVSNVAYDSTNKKITKTINGTTSDVVTASTLKSAMALNNVENKSSATIRGELTSSNVTTALGYTPLNSNLKGANSGLAELDSSGKVPSSQLPSYVDDVLEYTNQSSFPTSGETGKIYVAADTNKTYRWSGTAYVEISPSLALGTTSSTAFRGDHGNSAYTHAVTNKGSAFASGLYKITTNSEGHVTAATAVAKSDITALGIPASNTNTHRPIQVDGTQTLGDNTTALNLKSGTNVSLSADGGAVTISATDTTYESKTAASGGTAVSLVTTGEKYTWNNKASTSVATTSANGLMSSSDKTKLNGIAEGATANAGTITGITMNGASKGTSGVVNLGTVLTSHQDISGKVDGPSSSVSNNVAIFDGTSGKVIKDSGYTIAKSVPSNAVFTDTNTKVTSAANHYTPSTASGSDVSASATGATAAWSIDVVKGVTLNTDGKGHVTGVAVTSGKIPANPNTNTTYTLTQDSTDGHKITLTPSSGTATTITIPDNDTTYESKTAASGGTAVSLVTTGEKYTWNNKASTSVATTSANGLMSSSDKTKLNGIAEGATANTGTITGITMNGASKGTSGVVNLGTVLTSHQDISGKANLASPAFTGTPTAPTAADGTNTTQIATTAFVMNAFKANDAMIFKGTIGSSGATVTALPTTHYQGWTYRVITAGSYAGKACEIGDMLICVSDGTSANNDHWTVVQTNIDGAVTGPSSSADAHIAVFSGTSGKIIKDGTYTIGKSVPSNAVFTDTDTKVTSAANHYAPSTASGSDVSASATGATAAWSIDVVKGVTLNTDGKGHVTGMSVTSGKIPANPNTHRVIKVNGTQALASNSTALNLIPGSNVSITDGGSGAITIAATNTTYSSQDAASGGTAVSLVTTGEKYTWNNKASTSVATTSANGLMSSTDKTKLDNLTAITSTEIDSIFANL